MCPKVFSLLDNGDPGDVAVICVDAHFFPKIVFVDSGIQNHVVGHNEEVGEPLLFQVCVGLCNIILEVMRTIVYGNDILVVSIIERHQLVDVRKTILI
jgi:hypothetical protein